MLLSSSCIVTVSILEKSVARTVCVFMPIYVSTSVALFDAPGMGMVNMPLASVVVLRVEPFSDTVTPGRGCLVSSTTMPRSAWPCCCCAAMAAVSAGAATTGTHANTRTAMVRPCNIRRMYVFSGKFSIIYNIMYSR